MHRGAASVPGVVAGACALFIVVSALAQEAAAPPETAAAVQPPTASHQPGLFGAFGRWLEEGAARFKSEMHSMQERLDKFGSQARETAKEATATVVGLPNTRIVTGRERCAAAPNGAPDCQTAASLVCRGKGFQSGKSVDTQSEQKCPGRLLLEGRAPNHTDCATETFVTRAVCQ